MQVPCPIPHPLAWWHDAPGVVVEALEWVVGVEWPEGDEKRVWDLADNWYGAANELAPTVEMTATAGKLAVSGFGGPDTSVGTVLDQAWLDVAGGPDADLPILIGLCNDVGELLEQCGCDIQAAKIEMYVELGFMVLELLATVVAAVATLGTASAAAPAVTVATRWSIQQIFKRLLHTLLTRAVRAGAKEAAERVMTKALQKGLTRSALHSTCHALEEGAEEVATDFGTQTYQIGAGRREDFDRTSLLLSAGGGGAGGALGGLAGLGPHAPRGLARFGENVARGSAGEVIAETGASLVTGQGVPDLGNLARSVASGGVSGSLDHTRESLGEKGSELLAERAAELEYRHSPVDLTALAGASAEPPALSFGQESSIAGRGATELAGQPVGGGEPGRPPSAALPVGDPTHASAGAANGGFAARVDTPSLDGVAVFNSTVDITAVSGSSPAAPEHPAVDLAGATTFAPSAPTDPPSPVLSPTDPGPAAAAPDVPGAGDAGPVLSGPTLTHPTVAHPVIVTSADGASVVGEVRYGALPLSPTPTDHISLVPDVTAPSGLAGVRGTPGDQEPRSPVPGPHRTVRGAAEGAAPNRPLPDTLGPPAGPHTQTASPKTPGSTPHGPERGGPARPEPVRATYVAHTTSPSSASPATVTLAPVPSPLGWPGAGSLSQARAEPVHSGRSRRLSANEAEAVRWERVNRWATTEQDRRFGLRNDVRNRIRPEVESVRDDARRRMHRRLDAGDLASVERIQRDELAALERRLDELDILEEAVLRDPVGLITVPADLHMALNTDLADIVTGGMDTDDRSALTGTGDPPPVQATRAYFQRGGHRPPLEYDQRVIEDLIPRDEVGRPQRMPDPFAPWFGKLNDSGPGADPTRGINCVDCVLSLFDTWMHGRPRVSAPRTFDAYLDGDVRRPIDGELGGLSRARRVLGTPFETTYTERSVKNDTSQATYEEHIRELERSLLDAGPGAFAMINTEWRDGGAHAWAAVNYEGTVVYLDPQHGIADYRPLYNTRGPHGVGRMDIAVVDGAGRPIHLAPDDHQPQWHGPGPTSRPNGDPHYPKQDQRLTGGPASERPSHREDAREATSDGCSTDPVSAVSARVADSAHVDPEEASADPGDDARPTTSGMVDSDWRQAEGAQWRDQAVARVAADFGLAETPHAVQAIAEAYEVVRDHIAPFVVKVAIDMLNDFRLAVTENPTLKIVFIGRDGDALGSVVDVVDPIFYADHCTTITVSRKLGMLALLDAEQFSGGRRLVPDDYRWNFREPPVTDGALLALARYLEERGVPLEPGAAVTVVDSSFKGSIQEFLAAMFPHVKFEGAYIWHGPASTDPHPGTKKGYVQHFDGAGDRGNIWETIVYEYSVRGPLSSPDGFGPDGRPRQIPGRQEKDPLSGIREELIDPRYRNLATRDGVLAANRLAIEDYAQHIRREAGAGDELKAGFRAFRNHAAAWYHEAEPEVPRRFLKYLDSFVRTGPGGRQRGTQHD